MQTCLNSPGIPRMWFKTLISPDETFVATLRRAGKIQAVITRWANRAPSSAASIHSFNLEGALLLLLSYLSTQSHKLPPTLHYRQSKSNFKSSSEVLFTTPKWPTSSASSACSPSSRSFYPPPLRVSKIGHWSIGKYTLEWSFTMKPKAVISNLRSPPWPISTHPFQWLMASKSQHYRMISNYEYSIFNSPNWGLSDMAVRMRVRGDRIPMKGDSDRCLR